MKIVFSVFSAICALLLALPGEAHAAERRGLNIVISSYPGYIMALNVCKDVPGLNVTNFASSAGGCLHDYSITAGDMMKLSDADAFIVEGAGMEPFIGKIAGQYPLMNFATLSDGIELIGGHDGSAPNGHVWLSVTNAIIEVKRLGKVMTDLDPAHMEIYRANTDTYVAKLEALRARMKTELAPLEGAKIVTFHEAFPYFAREFGLDIAAVVEREPGSEPSARELAETIDLIKAAGIKAIFSEPQYPASAADTISKETGAAVYTLDPAVTGPDDPDAYLNIMEANLSVLKRAL
ncbi:MAG: zinc ABC transporter substrate-binding protein [Candidatus Omnitrophota bacterium]